MNENITSVVTGMAQDGVVAPTNWIAVFTNIRAIFLKASKHTVVEMVSPLANRIASQSEVDEIAASLKTMSVQQILDSEFEKLIFTTDNLNQLRISERPASFFRSTVSFSSQGKEVKLKMYKDTIRLIKSSLQIIKPTDADFVSKPLHSGDYDRNISYSIKALGLVIFFYSLWHMVSGVGVMDVLLAVSGILIFFKRKIGGYVLLPTVAVDLLILKFFAQNIDIEVMLKDNIILVIFAGAVAFLWKFRNQLK